MKTVLHLINVSGPGGGETVCLNLAKGLLPPEWRSVVVVPDRGWLFRELAAAGISTEVLSDNGAASIPRYLIGLWGVITKHDVDIIQAHFFGPTVIACLIGILRGIPVVGTLHGQGDVAPSERFRRFKLALLRHPKVHLVFVSARLRTFFANSGMRAADRGSVVPNGIHLSHYGVVGCAEARARLNISTDAFLVGAVGNIRPAKAYDVFLRAAALLVSWSPDYRFVIIGQGNEEKIQSLGTLRDSLGLTDAVHITGFRNDVPALIPAFDVFVLSSRHEGFAISIVEGMASAKPVVATRCGGPEDVIESEATGILVENGSSQALAAAIEQLRRNPQRRAELGVNARKVAETRFDVRIQVEAYERLYRNSLHCAGGPSSDPARDHS